MVKVVGGQRALALHTAAVSDASGVPISTLNHWVAQGLCKPSVLGPAGNRITRYWHPRDLVIVQAVRALRLAGCSLRNVRKVQHLLEEQWDTNLADSVLLYDGRDVLIVRDASDRIVSAVREPGQGIFELALSVTTLPIGAWIERAIARSAEVDVAAEAARRARGARRRRLSEPERIRLAAS